MKRATRLEKLKKIITQQGFCSVSECLKHIDASDSTIRRDLSFLEKQGFIERYHGGAVDFAMLSQIKRFKVNRKAKEEIAKKAAELIKDYQIIIMGAGSTVSILGNYLMNKKGLRIITPSISLARQLSNNSEFKIILTGGEVDLEGHSMTGHLAELAIKQIKADTCILSCDSISSSLEVMNVSFEIASLKKYILEASTQKILIADHTKFGAVNMASIGSISQFDKIVVDSKLDARYLEKIKELGVEVII